ncbi:TolC family protein [Orenia marismortui]|uniref:TolC family type I secretion outer membrane protein n=1 Tax=Orenia marismortui TaxID=46469 RepID=A0A4R8HA25_9FIRM|nr:TolC family protein [Orenia marismortui]TDX52669.1 TolC family type I secretion outer membrane protein [Orenia marismortui]
MRNKLVILTVICILFTTVGSYAAEENGKIVLTKEEAIEIGLKQNPEIIKIKQELEIAKDKVKEARAGFLPKLNLSSSYTRLGEEPENPIMEGLISEGIFSSTQSAESSLNSYSFKLDLNQPLYNGGRTTATYEQAKKGLEIAKLKASQKRQEIKEEILNKYYGVLKAKKMVEVSEQNINKISRYVEIAKANREVGIFTNTDVLQARVNLYRAKQGLLKAKNGLKLTKLSLKNALNLENDVEVTVNEELKWEDIELNRLEVKEYAFSHRPDLKLLELSEDKVELGVKLAKSSRYPTLNLFGNYNTTDDSFTVSDGDWQVGLMLNYNLFDGGAKSSKIKQATKELEKFETTKEESIDAIELEIESSLLKISEAKQSIQLMQLSLTEAKENLKETELKYKEGIVTSFDVLNAQTTLQEVKTDYYEAIYDYNLEMANLERAMGKAVN